MGTDCTCVCVLPGSRGRNNVAVSHRSVCGEGAAAGIQISHASRGGGD